MKLSPHRYIVYRPEYCPRESYRKDGLVHRVLSRHKTLGAAERAQEAYKRSGRGDVRVRRLSKEER